MEPGEVFAHDIKIPSLNASSEEKDMMYEMLEVDDALDDIAYILHDFGDRHNNEFQIGANGRSGGYLVLYTGGMKPSGHKSYCPHCGQKNFKSISEGIACGVCGRERVDFKEPPMQIYTYPGVGYFDKWMELSDEEKLEQAEYFFGIVTDFDRTCEDYCAGYLDFAKGYTVEEQEIMVPKKVLVAIPREE